VKELRLLAQDRIAADVSEISSDFGHGHGAAST
jgi:hypothetical protein